MGIVRGEVVNRQADGEINDVEAKTRPSTHPEQAYEAFECDARTNECKTFIMIDHSSRRKIRPRNDCCKEPSEVTSSHPRSVWPVSAASQ